MNLDRENVSTRLLEVLIVKGFIETYSKKF